jgi:hypothetical protein
MSPVRFRPSRYGVSSAAAAAGGAAAAGDYLYSDGLPEYFDEEAPTSSSPSVLKEESTAAGGRHILDGGFLGLNWRSIGAAVVVGTLVAVGTDLALEFLRPRIFGKKTGKEG